MKIPTPQKALARKFKASPTPVKNHWLGGLLILVLAWLPLANSALAGLRPQEATAASPLRPPDVLSNGYPIGQPSLSDLWVDPLNGNDDYTGSSRDQALATITAAWGRIPQGTPLIDSGYRLMLAAGDYPESSYPIRWESHYGTAAAPILIQSADGPGAARLQGFINIYDTRYLYLIDLSMANTGDVFHCEKCDHLLLRGLTMNGGSGHEAHETVKINQSQYIYIENSDIFNTYENTIDFVAVQYGHILNNRLHDGDDWCIYLKGGSAYFLIEGNEIYNCGTGGFSAGQGSGLEFMVSPWLHYEAYDIKFINNLVHDTFGAGMGVNGGYNILLAHNTLYRVGANSHLIEVVFGSRSCDGLVTVCAANLLARGWGKTSTGEEGEPIPDRNIFIFNNLVFNPPGFQSQWQHFAIYGPRIPESGSNIPSPAVTDQNLIIRGNLIWNGGADMPLGIGDSNQGCQDSNPTCNSVQLRADNIINTIEPELVNPLHADFHPQMDGNIFRLQAAPIPNFNWSDAPTTPFVPSGNLDNQVKSDYSGVPRLQVDIPRTYSRGNP